MFPVSIDDVHWNRNDLLLLFLLLLLFCSELYMLLLLTLVSIVDHPILQDWCGCWRHCHRRALCVADRAHGPPHAVGGRAYVVSSHRSGTGRSWVWADVMRGWAALLPSRRPLKPITWPNKHQHFDTWLMTFIVFSNITYSQIIWTHELSCLSANKSYLSCSSTDPLPEKPPVSAETEMTPASAWLLRGRETQTFG